MANLISFAETADWHCVTLSRNPEQHGEMKRRMRIIMWLRENALGRYLSMLIETWHYEELQEVRFELAEDAALFRLTFQ